MSKGKKKVKKNNNRKININALSKKKIKIAVYLFLRILVVVSLIIQGIHGNWNNVFLCIVTLVLFTLPDFVSKKFNIDLPTTLEILTYLFIYSAAILGEIQNFYGLFIHWDTMLHTLNGFLSAAIGFSLVDILNNNDRLHIDMTPSFVALVAFCFSMTIGIIWEFVEFGVDHYFIMDMQKDSIVTEIKTVKLSDDGNEKKVIGPIDKTIISNKNGEELIINGGYLDIGLVDTMKDLFVNFIGAVIFSILGYLYIKNREGYKLLEIFVPRLKSKIE